MGRSHVKVFVRTRPTARPYEGFRVHEDGESITIKFPKEESSGLINNQLDSLTFKFDGILENVSQDTVYGSVVQDAVESVLAGLNATVFCYGQTGAGKTFTMCGDARNYHHRGIIPRALHHIFRQIDMRPDKMYRVVVSCLEIYNETLYDLLSDAPGGSSEALAILEDSAAGGVSNVRGLTQVVVSTEEEALSQYFTGEQARSTAHHMLNAASSRSHVLFGVAVEMRTSQDAAERAVVSKLALVDLAGSERTKKTNASGDAMREAACINRSLSFLEQVVNALARKDAHVPFRQTKLTAALKDALGGNCKTVMVANLWPEPVHLEECVSTLRFASRVRSLVTDAVVNESNDPALLIKRYERQVRELKQELAMRDTLSGRGHVSYDNLSEAETRDLQDLVARYLSGQAPLEQLPTESLKRIRETYKAMKAVAGGGAAAFAGGAAPTMPLQQQHARQEHAAGAEEAGLVGDLDSTVQRGFLLGTAPLHARPAAPSPTGASPAGTLRAGGAPTSSALAAAKGGLRVAVGAAAGAGGGPLSPQQRTALAGATSPSAASGELLSPCGMVLPESMTAGGRDAAAVDLNALFLKWKGATSEGRQLAEQVRERQQQLKQLKQRVKEAAARVNDAKADVDQLSGLSADKRAAASAAAETSSAGGAGGGGHVLDGESLALGQQLKDAKARYRAHLDRLKELRGTAQQRADALAAAKRSQLDAFEAWCAERGVPARGAAAAAPSSPSARQILAYYGAAQEAGGGREGGGAGWGSGTAGAFDATGDAEELLDPAETFERLQMARIMQADPDSSAFHAAKRKAAAARGGPGGRAPTAATMGGRG